METRHPWYLVLGILLIVSGTHDVLDCQLLLNVIILSVSGKLFDVIMWCVT